MGRTDLPTVAIANQTDVAKYVELAQAAQAFIRSKGLAQWVPAAHTAFLPSIAAKVERRSLHKVSDGDGLVAFFDFSFDPSEWWTGRAGVAAYISGIVVARASRRRGIGAFILEWTEEKEGPQRRSPVLAS